MPRTSRLPVWGWLVGGIVFLIGATYAVGGATAFSDMRARVRSWLEPPTARQMQRATDAAAQQLTVDSAVRADTVHSQRQGQRASLGFMLGLIGAAVGATIILIVVSMWTPSSDTRPP
jgi:hypothetical protein